MVTSTTERQAVFSAKMCNVGHLTGLACQKPKAAALQAQGSRQAPSSRTKARP